jgi:hypothetical protein
VFQAAGRERQLVGDEFEGGCEAQELQDRSDASSLNGPGRLSAPCLAARAVSASGVPERRPEKNPAQKLCGFMADTPLERWDPDDDGPTSNLKLQLRTSSRAELT